MNSYFYSENEKQVGPVTIEDLKTKNIARDTMVWQEGMDDWQKAGEVKELASLFASVPPPLPKKQTRVSPPPLNSSKTDKISVQKYYYVDFRNDKHGPYTFDEMLKIGLEPENLVQKEGLEDWQAISSFPEFAKFYPNSKNANLPKPNKGPSAKVMFMRLIAIILGLLGILLLLSLFTDFVVSNLVIGSVSLVLSILIFKKNKVTYKMTDTDKGSHAGMMMGHIMNMNDD